MRWLGTFGIVLVLLFPASARAQSVKMADLVGTWVATSKWTKIPKNKYFAKDKTSKGDSMPDKGDSIPNNAIGDTLVVQRDSTLRWGSKEFSSFRFTGDSIFPSTWNVGLQITLKDQQLILKYSDQYDRQFGVVAERVDAPRPTP